MVHTQAARLDTSPPQSFPSPPQLGPDPSELWENTELSLSTAQPASDIKSKLQRRCGTFTCHFQPAVSQAHRGTMCTLPSRECQTLSHRVPAQVGGGQLGVTPLPAGGQALGMVPSGALWSQPVLSACLPAGIHRGWSHSFRTGTDMLLLSCTIPKAVSVAPKMDFTVVYQSVKGTSVKMLALRLKWKIEEVVVLNKRWY